MEIAQEKCSYTKTGHKRAHEMVKRSSKLDFRSPSIACIKRKDARSLIRPLKARRATFLERLQGFLVHEMLHGYECKDRRQRCFGFSARPGTALGCSAASGLQPLTPSHSLPAYLPTARRGLSLRGYRSSTPACDTLTSAPSLGPKTIPILHTEVPD